jgi:hypothetical protein
VGTGLDLVIRDERKTTMASTFITTDERIDMAYWAEGLLGAYSATADQSLLCNGEKNCL